MLCVRADSMMCAVALVAAIIYVLIEDSGAADPGVQHDAGQQAGPSNLPAGRSNSPDPQSVRAGKRRRISPNDKSGSEIDDSEEFDELDEEAPAVSSSGPSANKKQRPMREVLHSPDYGTTGHFDIWNACSKPPGYVRPKYPHENDHFNPFGEKSPGELVWGPNTISDSDKQQIEEWIFHLRGYNFMNGDSRKEAFEYLLALCAKAFGENNSLAVLLLLFGGLHGYSEAFVQGGNAAAGTDKKVPFIQVIVLTFFREHGHDLYGIIPPPLKGKLKKELTTGLKLPESLRTAMTLLDQDVAKGTKKCDKGHFLKSALDEMHEAFDESVSFRNENLPIESARKKVESQIMAAFSLYIKFVLYQAGATGDHKVTPKEFDQVATAIRAGLLVAEWPLHDFPIGVALLAGDIFLAAFHRPPITVANQNQVFDDLKGFLNHLHELEKRDPANLKKAATFIAFLFLNRYIEHNKLTGDNINIEGLLSLYDTYLLMHALERPQLLFGDDYERLKKLLVHVKDMYTRQFVRMPEVINDMSKFISRHVARKKAAEANPKPRKRKQSDNQAGQFSARFKKVEEKFQTTFAQHLQRKARDLPGVMDIASDLVRIGLQIAMGAVPKKYRANPAVPRILAFVETKLEEYYKLK